jgi:hypothetical protein
MLGCLFHHPMGAVLSLSIRVRPRVPVETLSQDEGQFIALFQFRNPAVNGGAYVQSRPNERLTVATLSPQCSSNKMNETSHFTKGILCPSGALS